MAIEFYCPGCGNLMRTPDETAGRKGRCPTCQLKVQIPAKSVASTTPESAVPRTVLAASAADMSPQPIRFDCASCGKTLSIAAANAGKKGKCPHCGELMSIPMMSPSDTGGVRWKGTPKQPATPTPPTAATDSPTLIKAGGEKIEFHCSSCNEVVRVGAAAAGKKGQCPRCRAVIRIPRGSTIALEDPLVPMENVPPTSPRPRSNPMPSGLTPIDGKALSPLEPLGLVGTESPGDDLLGIDSFGSTNADAGNPFGNDLNPYSAPAVAAAPTARPHSGERVGAEIATMICGGCLIFYASAQIVFVTLSLLFQGTAMFATMSQLRGRGEDEAFATGVVAGQVMFVVVGGIVMLTILAGGIQMIRFKTWGLSLTACILTILPCNCFCLLGLPIGIWGTIMLSLSSIRSTFR